MHGIAKHCGKRVVLCHCQLGLHRSLSNATNLDAGGQCACVVLLPCMPKACADDVSPVSRYCFLVLRSTKTSSGCLLPSLLRGGVGEGLSVRTATPVSLRSCGSPTRSFSLKGT